MLMRRLQHVLAILYLFLRPNLPRTLKICNNQHTKYALPLMHHIAQNHHYLQKVTKIYLQKYLTMSFNAIIIKNTPTSVARAITHI